MQPDFIQSISFTDRHRSDLGAEPIIDRDAFAILEELADEDDPDLVMELIGLFLEDSAIRTDSIAGARSEDPEAVGAAAHALKSASANIGALSLSSACAQLEGIARGSQEGELEDVIDRVLAMYGEVRGVLTAGSDLD